MSTTKALHMSINWYLKLILGLSFHVAAPHQPCSAAARLQLGPLHRLSASLTSRAPLAGSRQPPLLPRTRRGERAFISTSLLKCQPPPKDLSNLPSLSLAGLFPTLEVAECAGKSCQILEQSQSLSLIFFPSSFFFFSPSISS